MKVFRTKTGDKLMIAGPCEIQFRRPCEVVISGAEVKREPAPPRKCRREKPRCGKNLLDKPPSSGSR
jgi:hypothetical protein